MRTLLERLNLPLSDSGRHTLEAALILGVALAVARVAGVLGARWARSVAARHGNLGEEQLARTIARHISLFLALIGLYLAVDALDLAERAITVAGHVTYVLATVVAIRLGVRVVSVR